jgi:hypothetical protein
MLDNIHSGNFFFTPGLTVFSSAVEDSEERMASWGRVSVALCKPQAQYEMLWCTSRNSSSVKETTGIVGLPKLGQNLIVSNLLYTNRAMIRHTVPSELLEVKFNKEKTNKQSNEPHSNKVQHFGLNSAGISYGVVLRFRERYEPRGSSQFIWDPNSPAICTGALVTGAQASSPLSRLALTPHCLSNRSTSLFSTVTTCSDSTLP